MSNRFIPFLMQPVKLLTSGFVGAFLILVVVFVLYLESRPELRVWHLAELDERVYQRIAPSDRYRVNRYFRGSKSDPELSPTNLNRSIELASDDPRAGVLLLHGMSDSPFSLHNLGRSLNNSGAWVVGLRSPGHGTAPSGLVCHQRRRPGPSVDH